MTSDALIPTPLAPSQLRHRVDAASLRFATTAELVHEPLPWIGQEHAHTAAHFGLQLDQPDYHLFVLGDVGTGRSTLLLQAMREVAAQRPVPPDLCYLHNFEAPERPRALRLPAGQGRALRQLMQTLVRTLQTDIPKRLSEPDFKAELGQLEKHYRDQDSAAFSALSDYARERRFALQRESGQLIFTLINEQSEPLSASEMAALPKAERDAYDQGERELRSEIMRFMQRTEPLERAFEDGVLGLRRLTVKPLIDQHIQSIRQALIKQFKDTRKLGVWLDEITQNVLDNLELFEESDLDIESQRRQALASELARYRVNLVVDNANAEGAPVIVEDNPLYRSLFGSVEYRSENDVLMTDFSRVRAGSLLKAHGGYLMLHVRDLLTDELVWEKLRRFLRSSRLQIEEPGTMMSALAATSLMPEAVDVDVKLVLVGSNADYYALQEGDPEFANHFRIKVDFAESFYANDETRHATGVLVAHTCQRLGLLHFEASAVARLIEYSHRHAEDQIRQSAAFSAMEAWVVESAASRTVAGSGGLLNIEREAELSGPIHNKAVLILHSYLSALFGHVAPLALSASVVFEQEYHGVEGDSASCAELYALLSSLSGVPLKQSIAVTGALNAFGDVLPIGGVNEKIEGFFRICQDQGLTGEQGVLIPERNRRHLMLHNDVVHAVEQGLFKVYTMAHALDGLALMVGCAVGHDAMPGQPAPPDGSYPPESLLGRAEATLKAYREACLRAGLNRPAVPLV
jgi:predicted ATP-dependent protease